MCRFSPQVALSRAFACTVVMLAIGLYSGAAHAHAIGLSTGEYTAKGASLVGRFAFARAEVALLAPAVDANRDGHLSAAEVESARGLLRDKILGRIAVSSAGGTCAPTLIDVGLTEQDGLILDGRWDCARDDAPFEIDLGILDNLAREHRHVARTAGAGATHDEVLYGAQRKLTVAPEVRAVESRGAETWKRVGEAAAAKLGGGFWAFFKLGIEHILRGYDHLVFIVGLVLARARLRSLLTIVTAFTVAHSITLALAVLGVWAPSARIVEPAIALSIAYVGIENFFVEDARKRWRITFPFGLIHGFGFAGVLQGLALPRSVVPTALVSFNLGVETGQLAVLAVLLPLVLFLRTKPWFEPRGVRILSGAVALAGGIWFLSRVISG